MSKAGTVTAIITDTHIGGFTGLSMPEWKLTGNSGESIPIQASPAQLWIYEKFIDFWQYVAFLAGVNGHNRTHRIICLHLGDMVDGIHHNSIQQLPNPNDQIDMAAHIMTNIAGLADGGVYGCMGTEPTHAGSNYPHDFQATQAALL